MRAKSKTAKRDAILDAAERLFARFGFRRTSVDDVAREAGIAKGSVYLHFEGKEAMLTAVLARIIEEAERRCIAAEAAKTPFPERLYGLLEAQLAFVYERVGRSDHLMELHAARSRRDAEMIQAALTAYVRRLTRFLKAADRRGEISLAASKLGVEAVIETIFVAADGAKRDGAEMAEPSVFRARLRNIAALVSAAVQHKARTPARSLSK